MQYEVRCVTICSQGLEALRCSVTALAHGINRMLDLEGALNDEIDLFASLNSCLEELHLQNIVSIPYYLELGNGPIPLSYSSTSILEQCSLL